MHFCLQISPSHKFGVSCFILSLARTLLASAANRKRYHITHVKYIPSHPALGEFLHLHYPPFFQQLSLVFSLLERYKLKYNGRVFYFHIASQSAILSVPQGIMTRLKRTRDQEARFWERNAWLKLLFQELAFLGKHLNNSSIFIGQTVANKEKISACSYAMLCSFILGFAQSCEDSRYKCNIPGSKTMSWRNLNTANSRYI